MNKVYWFLGVFIALLIAILSLLQWGNPQWNKLIFMYQCYDYFDESAPPTLLKPPSDYTGAWNVWNRDGRLEEEKNYKDGWYHGLITKHYYNMGKMSIDNKDGYIYGAIRWYYPNGVLKSEQHMLHHNIYGYTKKYTESGILIDVEFYKGDGTFDGEWIYGAEVEEHTHVGDYYLELAETIINSPKSARRSRSLKKVEHARKKDHNPYDHGHELYDTRHLYTDTDVHESYLRAKKIFDTDSIKTKKR